MDNDQKMMDSASTGQVNTSAAEIYEAFFVPALFGQWPDRLLDAAGLSAGDSLLDVGCGTGIVARAAERRLSGNGTATGLDVNPGMIAVARQSSSDVMWYEAPAEQMPFADNTFDCVVSQFALMFFADRSAALAEMKRVARPGGTIALATWVEVDQSPGYAAMVRLLDRLFGRETASALLAPFTVGTKDKLLAATSDVLPTVDIVRHEGTARFDSLEAWMHIDIRGWTLADTISDEQFAKLLEHARIDLAEFVTADGTVQFDAPALIATTELY